MELWPKDMSEEMRVRINEPMIPSAPESLPDIPFTSNEQSAPEIYDFQAMLRPTETSADDAVAITNRSPIRFPTSEPTTRSPDREVAFVPRGGSNKKRKLKKKVKPVSEEVPFLETSAPFTPSTNSVIEVMPNGEQQNVGQATPIYEFIDEPVVNIFQPIRYTDVISNLSNLTAQTFGTNNASDMVEIIDNPPKLNIISVDLDPIINYGSSEREIIGQINETLPIVSEITLNFNNDLSPVDVTLNQLKSAIEERDLPKIRNIVQTMDEEMMKLEKPLKLAKLSAIDIKLNELKLAIDERDLPKIKMIALSMGEDAEKLEKPMVEEKKIQVAIDVEKTTEAVMKKPSTTTLPPSNTAFLAEVPSTTLRSKIYLAPRVRAAQRKVKQVKAKSLFDEKLKDKASTSATEIPVMFTTKLKLTTEKMKIITAEPITSPRPSKGKRSHITPRTRNMARTATKSSRKQTSRRSERNPI